MVLGTWLEDELKKRRQLQINAAVTKAVAEERDKALAELQKWQTWNRNREAAQAAGQKFNEPPPSAPSADPENPAN